MKSCPLVGLLLICVCTTGLINPVVAQPLAQNTAIAIQGRDARLQSVVTLNAVALPLPQIVDSLQKQTGVSLSVKPRELHQRFTLVVTRQALDSVLSSLCRLCSHSQKSSDALAYQWVRAGAGYDLIRLNATATKTEQQARGLPLKLMEQSETELRLIAQTPKESRTQLKLTTWTPATVAMIDDSLEGQIYKHMSDADFALLLQGRLVRFQHNADTLRAAEKRYSKVKGFHDRPEIFYRYILPLDMDGTNPIFSLIYVSGAVGTKDGKGELAGRLPWGGIWINDGAITDESKEQSLANLPTETPDAPKYDLNALMDAAKATDADKQNPAYILATLARAANLNLYQEHFWSIGRTMYGTPFSWGGKTADTLPHLLAQLCDSCRLYLQRDGDTYFLYPYEWPFMRDWDVPESKIQILRKRFAANKDGLTQDDLLYLVQNFSWEQIKATICPAFPQVDARMDGWGMRQYHAARIFALMTPEERTQAASGGIAVSALSPVVQATMLKECDIDRYFFLLRLGETPPPPAQVAQGYLTLSRAGYDDTFPVLPETVVLHSADKQTLYWVPARFSMF